MEFLTNPAWISVIIAALSGIILPTVYFLIQRRNRHHKQITTEVISNRAVVFIDPEIKSKVQTTFNTHPINDVHLIHLKVTNTGNESVDVADYARSTQIKFDFGNQARVLEAELSEAIPSTIKNLVRITSNPGSSSITLRPLLLKSREAFTLRVIVASFEGEIRDETRLIGAKQVLKASLSCVASIRNLLITFITLMLASPLLFIYTSQGIFRTFLFLTNPSDYSFSSSGVAFFYSADLFGAIIVSFIIFIIYFFIAYLLPYYITTPKQIINLGKSNQKSIKKFIIIAAVLLLVSPLAYGLITALMASYIYLTFHVSPFLSRSMIQNLNIADTIGSILTTIILIIGIFFLDKYFPIKIPSNK